MLPDPRSASGAGRRLRAILLHVPYFSIEGPARLAAACRVAPSTISRILRGRARPDASLQKAIARALSAYSGLSIPVREIFPQTGDALTPSVCELMDCSGCLPPEAWDEGQDVLRENWRGVMPSLWSRSRYPSPSSQKTGFRSSRQAGSIAGQITIS